MGYKGKEGFKVMAVRSAKGEIEDEALEKAVDERDVGALEGSFDISPTPLIASSGELLRCGEMLNGICGSGREW